eukprot:7961465-Pyramimonas_sp.AAC.1
MDIAAAFPSLGRQWMWNVIERWGMHGHMLRLLKACYFWPASFLDLGGERRPPLIAASGVAQGCPLSGAI